MWICRITGKDTVLGDTHLCDSLILKNGVRFDGRSLEQQRSIIGEWPIVSNDKQTSSLLDMISVQRIADKFQTLESINEIETLYPIVPDINDKVKISEFEIELEQLLPHLQYVCHQPHLRLEIEEEVLPISRSKRWSNRAIPYLLSHPEHWERRTLTGVQPSHLLSKVIVDKWDLYENRVSVRLVDLLIRYLSRRIHEIEKIIDLNNFEDFAVTSYWRRRNRVYSLWGEVWNTENDLLNSTLNKLIQLRTRVLGLLQSTLCKNVSKVQASSSQLKGTNILNNDPHYRKVALLWKRLFESDPLLNQQSEQEKIQERIKEGESWQKFVHLLVIRGFLNIGWDITTDSQLDNLHFKKPGWSRVSISCNQYGIMRLICRDTTFIIAPMCANVQDFSSQLTPLLKDIQEQLLVVHPGQEVSQDNFGKGWHLNNQQAFLNVSPWALDSEEKVSRVLQVWLAKFAFPPLPLIKKIPNLVMTGDWFKYENSEVIVIRKPTTEEKNLISKGETLQNNKSKRQKKSAPNTGCAFLLDLVNSLDMETVILMTKCPILNCGSNKVNREYISREEWKCSCNSCNTRWGIKECLSCKKKYAFLSVHGDNIDEKYALSNQNPDEVFGSEIWAYPKTVNNNVVTEYYCSFCGK